MGSLVFTATDDLLPSHPAGTLVALDIDFQEARKSRSVEKTVQRSQGGAMEVLKHRTDVLWDITFEPVSGFRLRQMREFIASTEGGESFSMDPYGGSAPLQVKRIDGGSSEEPFMRIGAEAGDYFTFSIQVLQL